MAIQRRSKLPPVVVDLADILPEDEGYAGYRAELRSEQARLHFRRVGGAEVDRWQRELQRAQLEITRANIEHRKETGVSDVEAPESADLLRGVYEDVFRSAFVRLDGFELEGSSAEAAWGALYDYMPLMVVLAGAAALKAQRPSDPES